MLKKHLLEKDSIHSLSTCNWVCFFCFQMGAYSHWPKNRVGTVFLFGKKFIKSLIYAKKSRLL